MPEQNWNPTPEQRLFIRQYAKAVEAGDAAVFAGAGLSRPAGFVDWKGLLKEIAEELKLDLDRETDLIAVAQYHVNKNQNRAKLNEAIIDEFTKAAVPTRNHFLLSRLPVETVWTTNYDTLIERAFDSAGKVVDVKINQENLAQSRRGRDVVVHKMHGCVTQPHDAVLTKDDYERYERSRPLFVESLKGDLISKTFLFLGFSFTDPNIDYVLSRIRVLLGQNQRSHFAIMRKPPRPQRLAGKLRAEFEYEQRKLEFRIDDLRRFAIETVLINEYSDVERLLDAISAFAHRKNVFVSGSAHEYGVFGQAKMEALSRALGQRVIEEGFNLVSGFGIGIGEHCVVDALRAVYHVQKGHDVNRVIARPFPRVQGSTDSRTAQSEANLRHREDLIARSGAVVFVAGNRRDSAGRTELSPGVREEFAVARRLNRFVIPIGATGFVARELWEKVTADTNGYFRGTDVSAQLAILGDTTRSVDELVGAVLDILRQTVKLREL